MATGPIADDTWSSRPPRQASYCFGRQVQVDVVRHEAIGAAGHPRPAPRRCQEGAISAIVVLPEKKVRCRRLPRWVT